MQYLKYGFIAVLAVVLTSGLFYYLRPPVTTVILVRHADRDDGAEHLNSFGTARAQELARILDETRISAIYASNAVRTQETASPLATRLGLSLNIYQTDDTSLAALANEIKTQHARKVVLVVGHSNTVNKTIASLGITSTLPDIPHSQYDHMYIVTLGSNDMMRLLKMEYGADTQ